MDQTEALEQIQNYQQLQDLSTQAPPPDPMMMGIVGVVYLVAILLYVVSFWRIFSKAGKPGWAAIVPIYNLYVLLQIIHRPGWWLLLYFIPGINIIISLVNSIDLAKVFGQGTFFGLFALWLFSFIGYPMLAFGKYTYTGGTTPPPAAPSAPAATPAPAAAAPATPAAPAPKTS